MPIVFLTSVQQLKLQPAASYTPLVSAVAKGMKREELSPLNSDADSALDDWRSGAAAILDTIEDVMWNALRELPSPHSPRPTPHLDAIRGASPVKSPDAHVLTLSHHDRGGISPICDDSPIRCIAACNTHTLRHQSSMLSGDESEDLGCSFGSQLDTMWTSGMAVPPAVPAGVNSDMPMPLTWANVVPNHVLNCEQLPNVSALERRRQKNRDCMRRARQKQRDELQAMKIIVERLEKQYAELSLRSANAASNVSDTLRADTPSSGGEALVARTRMASKYSQAVDLARRLGAENLYLKAEIQQQQAWKVNLTRILQSGDGIDGPRWAQQFQQPSLGGEEVLRMQLDKMDELDASEELGYHALSDLDLTHVILENRHTIGRVQSRLLVPSSLDTEGDAQTRRMQVFGWDMVQRVDGNIMECVFTKEFRGLNVAELMQKTWANDMRLGEFKKVKGETCRLEVLQQVNPNAYVLCRDVISPTNDISIFRSVFVRFLIETSKRIPTSSDVSSSGTGIDASAPSTPPQYAVSDSDGEGLVLEATGYVLGTQSVDTDYSRCPRAEDMFNKVAWAHLSLSIEFLNVINPVTGEEYQQLCWSGRTNYCGPEHAQRNASDMLQGVLRWELVVISPALNLVSLSLE